MSQNHVALTLNYNNKDIHKGGSQPGTLAENLTKDKAGDKEKFDAIFAWVASNIKYDFRTYYSSNGSGHTDFKKMLRHRSGICVNYAALMDTLCSLAGIVNVSVNGYAKDEIFDVHDSIYVDNHAWNAVKLNGLWYVYDVTWASGAVDYRFTRFSRFLLKLEKLFPVKFKRKKTWGKKLVFFDECGNEISTPPTYKERFFNRLMRRILTSFTLKVEEYYTREIDTNYYLTNPELFAVTHFPDNPAWSLTAKTKMRTFETDSAIYHFNENSYVNQNRGGRVCPDCDYDLSLDALNKQHHLRNESFKFNKRNRFVSSLCEFYIGSLNFNDSRRVNDSLPKITLLDTSLAYLQHSRTSLRNCFRNIDTDFLLQKSKNKRKQMMLLFENRNHLNFIKEKINVTIAQKRRVQSLANRTVVTSRKLKRRKGNIRGLKSEIFVDTKSEFNEQKLEELNAYHNRKVAETDSLTRLIQLYKARFDSVFTNLSLNIWQKVIHHDSLIVPILESTQLRKLLKDNLKKEVVETRKRIGVFEADYSLDIDNIVYAPSEFLSDLGVEIIKLIDIRNNFENDLFHSKLMLVKFNAMPLTELAAAKTFFQTENKDDYCWLRGKIPALKALLKGFKALRYKQVNALKVIVKENEVERRRTHFVSKELLRRKKKYRRIVIHNARVTSVKLIEVRKEKRSYLNLLKKQRRKAAKKI